MAKSRHAILELFQRGFKQVDIVRVLKIASSTVNDAIKRFKELGHEGDRTGRGRKFTKNIASVRNAIKKRVQRNCAVSMRKVAKEMEINRETVRKIAVINLGLKPYKSQKVQRLTDKNKEVRLQRCRQLLRRAAGQSWESILFTDEKIFTIEQAHNHQNDRNWCSERPTTAIVEHRQNPQSVMVWAGICATGKTPLVFVEKGVKINQQIYRRDILQGVVLPWAQHHFGDSQWTFQQDSAPAHKAKLTQEWCRANYPDFITSEEWPPYSPDLNPMDYSVWSILEAKACAKPHKSLEALKRSLLREWDLLTVEELRKIAQNFIKRLRLCVAAKGSHFEIN